VIVFVFVFSMACLLFFCFLLWFFVPGSQLALQPPVFLWPPPPHLFFFLSAADAQKAASITHNLAQPFTSRAPFHSLLLRALFV